VVGNANIQLIQNKSKKSVQNAKKFILFHLHGLQNERFVVKSVKTTQFAIMFQEAVGNVEKHLNYQGVIWKEAGENFVLLAAI
ncbi:hypothetical protein, partial [Staphylococcus aureus]|uniref:hypothetical protein n=1 Tax=Staphylococcus aureus TaxID=1280 RepID=UPI001E337445